MVHAAVDSAERGEQPTPGVMTAFEDFLALLVGAFAEQFAQGGDGVVLVVKGIAKEEQAAFICGKQEDEAHHHRESAVVNRLLTHVGEERAARLGVQAVERLHEHLDGPADLIAELLGDFLLVLAALGVERGEGFRFGDAQEAAQVKQAVESAKRERLLHPQVGIPRGEAGGFATGRIDDHPLLAIGHEAERHVRGVEQFHHARAGRGFPTRAGGGFFQVLIGRVVLNEEQGLLVGVAVFQDEIGPQRLAVVGHDGFHARRDGLTLHEKFRRVFQHVGEDVPNPSVMNSGLRRAAFEPIFVGFAQAGGFGGVTLFQALREDAQQHRHGQEWPGGFDEGKPFGVMTGGAHRLPPDCKATTARGGTRKVTATGKSRGCGSL